MGIENGNCRLIVGRESASRKGFRKEHFSPFRLSLGLTAFDVLRLGGSDLNLIGNTRDHRRKYSIASEKVWDRKNF